MAEETFAQLQKELDKTRADKEKAVKAQHYEWVARLREKELELLAKMEGLKLENYEFTKEQIAFLENLNDVLRKKEKELLSRYRALEAGYIKRRRKGFIKDVKNTTGDLDDYELDVIIEFAIPGYQIKYRNDALISGPEDGEHCFGTDTDWHEGMGRYPKLKNPMCYTMHCLLYHSEGNINKWLFRIHRIDYEIIIREQQFEKISGGGFFEE